MDRRHRNILLVLLSVSLVWFAASRSKGPANPQVSSTQPAQTAESQAIVPEVVHRDPLAPETKAPVDPPRRMAVDTLKEYWGSRWGEVERALKEKGVDTDVPFELVPWETA